jgi:hypothetical protein
MKTILGAAIGGCVHVAGLLKFLELSRQEGYQTIFLGPAVPVHDLVSEIELHKPDIVAISYRLTPEVAVGILNDLKKQIEKKGLHQGREFIFGGTPKTVEVAKKIGFFKVLFSGENTIEDVRTYLKGSTKEKEVINSSDNLVERIKAKSPYPLLRHHFGLPALKDTIEGSRLLSSAKVLDILSIAPDQNAQEFFFDSKNMDRSQDGAGGVAIRNEQDLIMIYDATRQGNFPLLRCYSGTKDLVNWAEMLHHTLKNAWGAVPLFWYSELDGRSKRPLLEAIKENQAAIKWYAQQDVPVETTDSHQWALRGSGDTIEIATAFLGAFNAKTFGVRYHIQQYMLNTPPEMTATMDLAKMFVKMELVEALQDENFHCLRMIRPGLQLFGTEPNKAKGQLAASLLIGMCLKPHIVHVVSHCEGDHAARPEDIIEGCMIAKGAIQHAQESFLPFKRDPEVKARMDELRVEVRTLLRAIEEIYDGEGPAFTNPEVLFEAVKLGILDAPQLKGTVARGAIVTKIIGGACRAVDQGTQLILPEKNRLKKAPLKTGDIKREMVDP